MQLRIFWVGKTRNASIRNLCGDYLERVRHFVPCEIVEAKDVSRGGSKAQSRRAAAEARILAKRLPSGVPIVALDSGGLQMGSEEFAGWFERKLNEGTREICFVIGGVVGLEESFLKRAELRLSLGKMTWTHDTARFLLLEQIYRAFCIIRRIPYHK